MPADWSIQEVARLTGITSRTLRHYDNIGLLDPSRIATNGYRYYDADALVRLQRILLLRDLGLGLPAIGKALAADSPRADTRASQAGALGRHLDWLRTEQDRLARQVAAVEHTITTLNDGGELMAEEMLAGFDHTQYQDEVIERWGADAYARSDTWWRELPDDDRADWTDHMQTLTEDWTAAASAGIDPASEAAQALAARHVQWLGSIPGTPGAGATPVREYILELADMYVADARFAHHYGGVEGAAFVRDALRVYVETQLD